MARAPHLLRVSGRLASSHGAGVPAELVVLYACGIGARALIAAAGTLLVLGVACGPAHDEQSSPGRAEREPDRPKSARPDAAGHLVFLLPSELPEQLRIGSATRSAGPQEAAWWVKLAQPDPDDRDAYLRPVTIFVSSASSDREVAPDEAAEVETVVIGGVAARLSDSELTGAVVDWFHNGKAIVVVGPQGERDVVVDLARKVELERGGPDLLSDVPDGYVVLSRGESPPGGSPRWSLVLREGDGPGPTVSADLVPVGSSPVLGHARADRLDRVTVRGADAFISSWTTTIPGTPARKTFITVSWLERPDVAVSVTGSIDRKLAFAIAESFREVSEEDFLASSPPRWSAPVTSSLPRSSAPMSSPTTMMHAPTPAPPYPSTTAVTARSGGEETQHPAPRSEQR